MSLAENIIGQNNAKDVLNAALSGERMHHAWIFHGPSGVGKATTAIQVARILLDPNAQTDLMGQLAADPNSESTQLIDSPTGAHPDLHVISKELTVYSDQASIRNRKQTNIPVQIIRQYFIDEAYRSSQLRHGKVFIIDEAELLDQTGQNTMLKVLEEPPSGTFIFLICANEQYLLPTIRSRCQRVQFRPLSETDVATWVDEKLKEENAPNLSDDAVSWITRFARGSLGRAELAIDYGLYEWRQAIGPMLKTVASGKMEHDMGTRLNKMALDFAEQWVEKHPKASKDAANKAALGHVTGLIGHMCREAIHSVSANYEGNVIELEKKLLPWLTGIELLQDVDRYLSTNVRTDLVMDNLIVQWKQRVREGILI